MLHDAPDPEPEDIDWASMTSDEREARRRAERMVQEASIIELTSWTFDVLDAQPNDRMQGLLSVIGMRSELERQRRTKK